MKNNQAKCLCCYQPLTDGQKEYHASCVKKIFGTTSPPVIDFNLKEIEKLAKETIHKRIALTGVQPKLSLHPERYKNELARLTIVGLHDHYILKPPSPEYEELPQNEDVTMHLAALAKIKTATHCLIRLASGEPAYLTRRFDRDKKGNKIAMEDFCQLTENLTEHKYRSSIEKIAQATGRYTSNKGLEALRLFELVLFCYLTGNADMHLKNFALLENESGEFELSPAFDLVSTALAIPDDKEESALTINGKKNRLSRKDFDTLAQRMQIHEKALAAIYNRFKNILPEWENFINRSFLSKAAQKLYIELIRKKNRKLFS